jgi:myo-inositol-1(or 4)-monophosphatase
MSDAEVSEADLLEIAREAAEAAASELLARFGDGGNREGLRTKSTPTDLVSDADVAAEAAIQAVLREHRPTDAVLAEEGGRSDGSGSSGLRWLVDPLDGTVNFVFGIPAFAVSIACEDDGGTLVGVVLDPVREECFEATRSGAARLNGEDIVVSERASDLSLAMVATGFAYDAAMRARQAAVLARVLPRVRDIRRVGAAALDLCWAACGRFDAYYERGLNPWDLAAGGLIAERAGLAVHALRAVGEDPDGVVAAPPGLIEELRGVVEGFEPGRT